MFLRRSASAVCFFGQLLLQLCNLIAKLMRRLRQRVRQGRCRLPGVLEYGLLLREDCAFAARQPCVGTLHLLCRLLHRNKHLLGVPCKRGLRTGASAAAPPA